MASELNTERTSLCSNSPRHASDSDADKKGVEHLPQEPTDEAWLEVRKSLLQKPKFADALTEIGGGRGEEWAVVSRAEAVEILASHCSRYHGELTGEMWEDLIGVVTTHLGSDNELVSVITDHRQRVWTTCSLVTVSDVTSEETLDDATHMTMSAPTSHRAYGSIELITPSGKVALLAVGALAVGLIETSQPRTHSVETLEDTTVFLDTRDRLWYKSWNVHDCSPQDSQNWENTTTSIIQLVEKDHLKYYEENIVADVDGYQISSAPLPLDSPLYLLSGSSIHYQLCFSTNSTASPPMELSSEFLIFNDISNYMHFLHHPGDHTEDTAVFHQRLNINEGESAETCTNIDFNVSRADFYFMTYKVPESVVGLRYKAHIHIVSLNYTDYLNKSEEQCRLSSDSSCTISMPGNFFSTEEYTILAYVPSNTDTAPNATQLCVTPTQSALVSIIPGVVAGFVLLVLVILLVCQIVSFFMYRRRRGYFCIKNINV